MMFLSLFVSVVSTNRWNCWCGCVCCDRENSAACQQKAAESFLDFLICSKIWGRGSFLLMTLHVPFWWWSRNRRCFRESLILIVIQWVRRVCGKLLSASDHQTAYDWFLLGDESRIHLWPFLKFDSANVLPLLNWRKNCLTFVPMSCLLQSLTSIWLKVIMILNKMGSSWTNRVCFSLASSKKETETKFCHSPRDVLRSEWRCLLHFHFAQRACGCVAYQARRDGRLTQTCVPVCEQLRNVGRYQESTFFLLAQKSSGFFFSTWVWLFCLEAKLN